MLVQAFERYFDIVVADTPELMERVFRVRWEVYCKEFGYEHKSSSDRGLETDEFDQIAEHGLIVHKSSGQTAGCVRVVKPGLGAAQTLPLQRYCAAGLWTCPWHPSTLASWDCCEVSRLAVHSEFRRRCGESGSPLGNLEGLMGATHEHRTYPLISVALFLAATALVARSQRHHVYAMMEPKLARLLRRTGLDFQQVGSLVEYHGQRAAYYIHIEQALQGLQPMSRGLYRAIVRRFSEPAGRLEASWERPANYGFHRCG